MVFAKPISGSGMKTLLSQKKINFKDFKAIISQALTVQSTKVEQEN